MSAEKKKKKKKKNDDDVIQYFHLKRGKPIEGRAFGTQGQRRQRAMFRAVSQVV